MSPKLGPYPQQQQPVAYGPPVSGSAMATLADNAAQLTEGTEEADSDVKHLVCILCRDLAYHRCELCEAAVCTVHSRPFTYRDDGHGGYNVASRICFPCDIADSLVSESVQVGQSVAAGALPQQPHHKLVMTPFLAQL